MAKTKRRRLEKKGASQPQKEKRPKRSPAAGYASDGETETVSSDELQKLLEPYSKDQLIDFLLDAAVSDPSILQKIRSTADRDVAHRKIFVHGLGWDTTREILTVVFEPYGEIEDCNVVVDKNTGKAKGYGFVLFKTRGAAVAALKEPQKKIKNRVAFCQLASLGSSPVGPVSDTAGRKIYISNVHAEADPGKLRALFAKFGEIETGPIGYDSVTGKSRGFAMFVYKSHEGAKKALEEPHKMFEGHQLHCQWALENNKAKAVLQIAPPPSNNAAALAAAAAAQNLALFAQNPTLNPLYSAALLASQNAGLLQGGVNPLVGNMLGPQMMGSSSLLGAYGQQALALQSYQNAHLGHPSSGKANGGGRSSYL